ncbi:amidohydrolase family protein [Methylobacterium sp. J-077]|uniref:amidohydrolase family protein n=1 Tax=Methylobacterium sp. J-077 TaxID=2836656 RepID=UPI001FB9DFF2|nr:amidohydrolase family protein [Methylobacterium sp. J-077]MCJ2125154.1 amidohydrolase family protein [Methylobacterium sp. J-077]
MLPESGPRPCDLILSGGTILTLDTADTVFADGAIAVLGRCIAAIGPRDVVEAAWTAPRRMECAGRLLTPGLVNVHNHTPLMITRGMIEDLGFAPMFTPGIPQGHRLSENEAGILARLGVYEMLRNGCTTLVDFYRYPQALARAHAELGSRAVIAGRIHDADPEELTRRRYVYDPGLARETIRENADLIARFDGYDAGRIRCDWAPHAPDTCSDACLREVAELARRHVGNVHTHLCQSPGEVEQVQARSGLTPPQALEAAGLLDHRLIAAHCIYVDPQDHARMGGAGIAMAYTPIGNAKTGRIAPVLDLAEAGISITLCTDTFSGDLFEAMRWAVAMQRVRSANGFVLDARTALCWATQAGAERLGLGDTVGALTTGRRADILIMDMETPGLAPVIDGYGILVWSANGGNVRSVIVDGRLVIEDGRLTTADGPALVREAQAVAERLWAAAGRRPVTRRAAA